MQQIVGDIVVSPDVRRPFVGVDVEQRADASTSRADDARAGVMRGFRGFMLRSKRVIKKLACGAIAGAVSRTVTAPVETVKTVLMVSGDKYPNVGPLGTGLRIVKHDGWKGLFRGNGVNVLRVAPSKAIELFAFDTMRKVLVNEDGESRLPLPLPPASVAGACAGLSSTVICYPMEVMKTRLTVEAGRYSGIGNCFMTVLSAEGVSALYRGLVASAMGIIPYAATNYYTYDGLRKVYKKLKRQRMIKQKEVDANVNFIGTLPTLVIGSVSGAIAASVTFPLEVVRRQLQAGKLMNGEMYTSISDCAVGIMRKQGIRGFYRGLGPSCVKLMPAAGAFCLCLCPQCIWGVLPIHQHVRQKSSSTCSFQPLSTEISDVDVCVYLCVHVIIPEFCVCTGISFATYEGMKVLLLTEKADSHSSSPPR